MPLDARAAGAQPAPAPASAVSSSLVSDASAYHSLSHAYQSYLSHDQEEQNHWEDVCRSYRQYATFAMTQWANHQYRLHAIPEHQRRLLPAGLRRETAEFQERSVAFKEAAIRNQFCVDSILRHAGQTHSQEYASSRLPHSSDSQMSKVSSVLKSLARDWSAEGKAERDMTYQPILASVQQYLPLRPPPGKGSKKRIKKKPAAASPPGPMRICVPGAGVGRLACELAALGYAVQGNEFSLYMLLASDFILNGGLASPEHPLQISPYLLESRNVHASTDPTRSMAIPDVDPYTLMSERPTGQVEFSMAGGEFVSIYSAASEKNAWDAVVACFFLDTSPSVVEYLQVSKCRANQPSPLFRHFRYSMTPLSPSEMQPIVLCSSCHAPAGRLPDQLWSLALALVRTCHAARRPNDGRLPLAIHSSRQEIHDECRSLLGRRPTSDGQSGIRDCRRTYNARSPLHGGPAIHDEHEVPMLAFGGTQKGG